MKEQLYIKICQFAKRQMTWFKKFNNVFWIENKLEEAKNIINNIWKI
jgi:tRNA A37 N6-isopentenylltransferase MiaA